MREVFCEDALEWLARHAPLVGCSLITSLPDVSGMPALGLTDPPARVPWPILQLLAPGPALGREQALLAHDGVAADPGAVPVRAGN